MGGKVVTSEHWRHIEEILVASWGVDPELRDGFIRERCGNDLELLSNVRSLVEADSSVEQWTAPASETTALTQMLGHYELERLIGRGGMGAVYLAHRADGEFDQQVAVKIIGLPFELEEIRDRFRRERQILAGLRHPNITRLLDGGVTDDGQLYLVMEYVDGLPINRFPADLDKKLDLFLSVCGAVQYAHQNLIVHCDIKPSNILVDNDGAAKLLDFGAAKLLDDSDATRTGFRVATLAYASPEQLRGETASTLSDVFSLGAVLYELVAGEKAFGDDLGSRLGAGETRALKLPQPLAGDLDIVVRKALALVAVERYQSVEQLAEDIRRHRKGQPLLAHAPSWRYRAGKFIRRNKLALCAAVLLLLTLLTGIGAVFWQYRTAVAERARAEARADDLRKLSDSLLTEIDEAIQRLPGSTQAQKLLVSTVLEHLDRTVRDSPGDSDLEVDAANGYVSLANVQSSPYNQNIGDTPGALASLAKALSILTPLRQREPGNVAAKQVLALARRSRGDVLFGRGRTQEAVVEMRSAIAAFEELASVPNASRGSRLDALLEAAVAYIHLGDEFGMVGWPSLSDFPAALFAYHKAGETYQRAARIEPANLRVLRGIVEVHRKGGAIQLQIDPADAVSELREAVTEMRALQERGEQSVEFRRLDAGVLGPYAGALIEIGQYRPALAALEQGRAIQEALLAADPKNLRAIQDVYAGLSREAECFQDRAAGIFPEQGANRTADVANALNVLLKEQSLLEDIIRIEPDNPIWPPKLGLVLIDIGRQQRALQRPEGSIKLAQQGLSLLKEVGLRPNTKAFQLHDVVTGLITVEPAALREPALAVQYAERIVEMSAHRNPEFLLTLSQAYRCAGQASKALAAAREALAILPPETRATVPSRVRKLLQTEIRRGAAN
jgi:serine/threonine protein kinase